MAGSRQRATPRRGERCACAGRQRIPTARRQAARPVERLAPPGWGPVERHQSTAMESRIARRKNRYGEIMGVKSRLWKMALR